MSGQSNIAILNIYYMLAYVYQSLRDGNYENVKTEDFENIKGLFSTILANGITSQIKRGIAREYIERNEELATLRGKIDMQATMRLKIREERRLACTYDELSEDNIMNKILKTTALYLIRDKEVGKEQKSKLKRAILFFGEVGTVDPILINWRSFNYNRNNATYQMLMNICYLVLHELLLTQQQGEKRLAKFLNDQAMSSLYEKFLLAYYRKHFGKYEPAAPVINWDAEGPIDLLPRMETDITLTDKEHDKKLIIDAKYYGKIMQTRIDVPTVRSSNLYQIYSYVKNEDKNHTGLVDGMLLYAKTDEADNPDVIYRLGGNRIAVKTLDLNVEFSEIRRQLDQVIVDWQEATCLKA